MFFEHRVFWLPKDVNEPHGYEDAFEADGQRGIAAICDGVSTSLFSGRWAALLAKGLVADPPNIADAQLLADWLKRYREAWSASIDESTLAWHQKPKLLDGAASTLLWVELSPTGPDDGVPRPYRLQAFAIGDCCLFHIRGGQVLQTFPIDSSNTFDGDPLTLRSVFKRADMVSFQRLVSDCHPGDYLVLATDAVAAWTMRQLEAGVPLEWEALWHLSPADWQQWLTQLRGTNQIRYDDSTLAVLRIGPDTAPRRPIVVDSSESILDKAEGKLRDSWKTIKGSLRKSLRGLSDSKWLRDE
jgi:hypothetical protein